MNSIIRTRNSKSSRKGLFRNFGLAFFNNFIEQLYILIREQNQEKQLSSHRIASEIFAGIVRGSKYWTLDMVMKNIRSILENPFHLDQRTLGSTDAFSR